MADRTLHDYRSKRDFSLTPEPGGGRQRKRPARRRRYVVQKHDAKRLHFDFRLEHDGVLKSWAVTRGPSFDPKDKRLAVRVEDHPLEYGEFEGTIPQGQYGGGTVMLWDEGTWEPDGDPEDGLRDGKLKFTLHGERLTGGWALVRMRPDRGNKSKRENWLLIKERDAEARVDKKPLIERITTSVRSGREMKEIAAGDVEWTKTGTRPEGGKSRSSAAMPTIRKPSNKGGRAKLPSFVAPQLCTLVKSAPEGEDWIHEIKFDGYRAVSAVAGGTAVIHTRKGLDWTDKFPSVAGALGNLPCRSALLDGELAIANSDGATDFGALQNAVGNHDERIDYYIFDLLSLDGEDLRRKPLLERKIRLEQLLSGLPKSGPLFYSDHVVGHGATVFGEACDLRLEGVVSKRVDAPYRSARSHSWVKVKCGMGQEFVIVGWRPSMVKGRAFSSILLAVNEAGRLSYRGRVGSGFGDAEIRRVWPELKRRRLKKAPVEGIPASVAREACFVEPELVAEIAFRGWTRDGLIRQGSFKGLRTDKNPNDILDENPSATEQAVGKKSKSPPVKKNRAASGADPRNDDGSVEICGVRLTHPDRILFPDQGVRKRALAEYYVAVSELILPHIGGRPVSLVRCPRGSSGDCFFQKHASAGFPEELHKVRIKEKSGSDQYLYIEDTPGLVAAAQMGVLELHVWGSHIDTLEKPDRLVFDLDPDSAVNFSEVRESAFEMRDRLQALGLKSFAMATGGKGVHIIVPLAPTRGWNDVKNFAEAMARILADEQPDRYLAKSSKAARKGRIFIDYLRNARGATAIAPFSSRARPGAPIAWPVSWQGLKRLKSAEPAAISTAATLLNRQKKDPWEGYFDIEQDLPSL